MAITASTLLIVVVFVLDVVAFSLAVAAEQRRNTGRLETDVNNNGHCVYESDIATGLGAGALVLLLVSQLLFMAATRCLCCGRAMRPSKSRSLAIALFVSTWAVPLLCRVFFIIAEVCLLAGAIRNAKHTVYLTNSFSCKALRKGIFGAGAAFIVFTGIASELYYINHSKASDGMPSVARDAGVTMGRL
ncbi:unnamed protein product [Linum tenue]|uniref:Uncharacterized protein n=1 Tax=Linum tenue TaxID=586396 RepID=A0AAV0JC80_9ROSI|nr:unnamed protein product [Linum tenue]